MTGHLLSFFDLAGLTDNATRAASVKASLTPRFFIAEHSVWLGPLVMLFFNTAPFPLYGGRDDYT